MNDDHEPNDGHELDPEARLRAADPAAGVEPRAGFVDGVVAAAAADAGTMGASTADGSAAPGAPAAPAAPVADLGAERARRRPRWIPVAAVAASLVVFGGAGYALGAANDGSSNLAGGAAPAISLQGVSGGAAPEVAVGADARAGAGAGAAQKMSADSMAPYAFGRNEFSSSGLGTTSGTAAGYGYDPRAASNVETVGGLAAALGVEGTPVLANGSWTVGSQDGTSASLTVGLDGTLSFSFYDPTLDPWSCPANGDGSTGSGGIVGGDAVDPATDPSIEPGIVEPCQPTGTAPSEATAIDALRSVISATGRDADAFEYTSQTWEGSVTRTAQAWPVIDGQRLDQSWTAEVSEEGLLNAYGALAEVVPIGDYEIVSEQTAFERLSDPRFGAQMTALPILYREGAVTDATTEWVPPTEPPAAPTSGASISWPVNQVEIVSARLGLASQWQPDGSVLVVPAYEFTDAGGGIWSVIAVADSKLDFSTTTE
ncbi:hypothetical protein [Agromyces aureus]|uniref:Uncharacterized protein n=1 Tax=Agromyces aureus TaxID=453304 RepID=A0A191WEB0_9MICO|nr:hypothetical protein [Agromyces aureus]ANJ26533.1 hypothetical protein ATC03_07180 [Agromyces aureus]